jgi:nitrate reductase (NAD(P)H)
VPDWRSLSIRHHYRAQWGAAGVSTALFTGVYLADLLALVKPKKGARHVIFEGADKLPNGCYGTSCALGPSTS